jgi:hypothetical protein
MASVVLLFIQICFYTSPDAVTLRFTAVGDDLEGCSVDSLVLLF